MIYITDCPSGECELTNDQLKLIKTKTAKGKTSYRNGCAVHGGLVIKRKSVCQACGEEFFHGLFGATPDNCKPCTVDLNRERMKLNKRAIADAKRKREAKECTTRGDYCISLNCDQYPACMDCDLFYPIFKGHDPGRMEQWTL